MMVVIGNIGMILVVAAATVMNCLYFFYEGKSETFWTILIAAIIVTIFGMEHIIAAHFLS